MLYFRKAWKGQWVTVAITPEEEKEIKGKTFETNKKIMEKIKADCKDMTEGERVAIFNTIARHYHYACEATADEKLRKGESVLRDGE